MRMTNIDMEAAIRLIAERRIEQAIEEGKFENLAGAGKPLDLEPIPADESARMIWWALHILKQSGFVPDEVVLRREIEQLKGQIVEESDVARRVQMTRMLNDLIRRHNTMGTNAMTAAGGFAPRGR
jgi:DnaJ homologue, subfamily C, member 28, conserved domain